MAKATRHAAFRVGSLIALAFAQFAVAEQYCYNSLTGSCTQMASIFDPCDGQVVTSCPGSVTPTPTRTPTRTPRPTGTVPPSPTPTPTAAVTPSPLPTAPVPTCGSYIGTVPVAKTPHTLVLYCGSVDCFAVYPTNKVFSLRAWEHAAVTINPDVEGAVGVYRAAWWSLYEQRCASVPLLPSDIRAESHQ